MVSKGAPALLVWATLSLALSITSGHAAVCRSAALPLSATILVLLSWVPYSSSATIVHWAVWMPQPLRSSRRHLIHLPPSPSLTKRLTNDHKHVHSLPRLLKHLRDDSGVVKVKLVPYRCYWDWFSSYLFHLVPRLCFPLESHHGVHDAFARLETRIHHVYSAREEQLKRAGASSHPCVLRGTTPSTRHRRVARIPACHRSDDEWPILSPAACPNRRVLSIIDRSIESYALVRRIRHALNGIHLTTPIVDEEIMNIMLVARLETTLLLGQNYHTLASD